MTKEIKIQKEDVRSDLYLESDSYSKALFETYLNTYTCIKSERIDEKLKRVRKSYPNGGNGPSGVAYNPR